MKHEHACEISRILIIDDDAAIHDDFKKILETAEDAELDGLEAGLLDGGPRRRQQPLRFDLGFASQGQEGCAKLLSALEAGQPFAIAFVDMRMPPGWNGFETVKRLWETDPYLQVVICSAYSDRTWKKKVQELGSQDGLLILKKPFDNIEVQQTATALAEKWFRARNARLRMSQLEHMVEERTLELRESETKAKAIQESAADGIITINERGIVESVNTAALTMFGYSRDALLGKNADLLMPGPYKRKHDNYFSKYLETGMRSVIGTRREVLGKRKDGSVFPLELSVSEIILDGERKLFAGIIRDITGRKKDELERNRLVAAIEQTAEAISVTDVEGTIQYVNPAFAEITGYAREESLGENLALLCSSNGNAGPLHCKIRETLLRGEVWKDRVHARTKNGTAYEAETTFSPVRDSSGIIVNFVSVSRDVTHEAELEEKLRQAHKMEAIGTLAGGIAHDFNNILCSILGFTEMAMEDVPDDSQIYSNLDEVYTAATRATELTKQILTFSRQTEQSKVPMKIQCVLREALRLLRGSLPSTIRVRQCIDENCGGILADPNQVHQVVMNLCTNAAQAMSAKGGILEIDLREVDPSQKLVSEHPGMARGRLARLRVRDTGDGIRDAVLKRIFDPFFTTKEMGAGTGLGLATAHGIVESFNGAITVESELGKGAVFDVYFPVHAREAPLKEEPPEEIPVLRGTERILLVDDEEQIARLGKTILERLGYTVNACTSSVQALETFRANPYRFDIAITDQTMPQLTGIAFAKELHRIRPEMPVILCTGLGDESSEKQAKSAGIREYLHKPVISRNLAKAVRRALVNVKCKAL